MQGEIDLILLTVVVGVLLVFGVIIYFVSTESLRYKLISLTFVAITIGLEIPHILMGDSLDIIDILVHVSAGLSIFMISTNLPLFKNKVLMSIIVVVTTILLVELFLSILELTMSYVNPIGIDVFEDILWTTVGGLGGAVIYTVVK